MTPQEPTDEQAAQMMRETKIKAAVDAMGEAIAMATGRPENSELIAAGYREMFIPTLQVPEWACYQPQQMSSFIMQFPDGRIRMYHWPDLATDVISATRDLEGRVRIVYRNGLLVELEGAAAQAYWDWRMEQYEMLKAQFDASAKAGAQS